MKKSRHPFLLLLTVAFCMEFFLTGTVCYADTEAKEVGNLYALSAVLMDGDSGRILYAKNGEEKRPMASTTKIMTCILVLENSRLDEAAEVSAYAASMPKVRLGVQPKERYLTGDLLYSLMLESHNDTAVVLAEHVAGSVEAFAALMNEKAKKIGCKDTWFITPNGLDAEEETKEGIREHSTTAADLARILRYCISESPKREEFLAITGTPSYDFSDCDGKRTFSCRNHNAFLTMMEGALTGKTGFTAKAGYCYVGALKRDNRTFIVALLGCGWPNNKGYKWLDTRKLMEYGLKNYTLHPLSEAAKPSVPEELPVENGQSRILGEMREVPLVCSQGEDRQVLLKEGETIEVTYEGATGLSAPVKRGETIGRLTYATEGWIWKTEEITAKEDVDKITFDWCLKQTVKRFAAG
nr:D-alanyl-D-alanine carboxypeptidase family protein [uncultured Blautia sp.]